MFMRNKTQTHIDPYEGTTITTSGKPSVNAPLTDFKLYGKSEQIQTVQGKNLFSVAYYDANKDPQTLTYKVYYTLKPNTNYTVSSNMPYFFPASIYFNGGGSTSNGVAVGIPKTMISSPSGELFIEIRRTGTDGNPDAHNQIVNGTYWIQMEEGSTATAYEPFVPTSPSPDYPSPINSVPSEIDVTSSGINLFDKSKYMLLSDYPETAPLSGYKRAKIQLKPDTTYKVSVTRLNGWTGTEGGYIMISASPQVNHNYTAIASLQYPDINYSPYTTGPDGLLYIGYSIITQAQLTAHMQNTLIQIEEGSTATAYAPYTGTITPITVKDASNNLHELCSLPEGTRDEVDYDGGKMIKQVKVREVTDGTGWLYSSYGDTIANVFYNDFLNGWAGSSGETSINMRCNISIPSINIPVVAYSCRYGKYINQSQIVLRVPKSELSSLDNAGAVAWINAQIAAHGNIIFMYEYATPQIHDLHPDEAAKIRAVKSVYPLTNLFTDAPVQPTLSCGIRKLGNRPYIEAPLIDELNNNIIDENGDNIAGLF